MTEHRVHVRDRMSPPRTWGKLKALLPEFRSVAVHGAGPGEFIVCLATAEDIEPLRSKLPELDLVEIGRVQKIEQSSGETVLPWTKPYGFVAIPAMFSSEEPVWHDGASSKGRLSGEVRFEMTNLTPLLVGWERRKVVEEGLAQVKFENKDLPDDKAVLCPLRAPNIKGRPVLISGDSLKGLLRHELGALLGAPMERVAERSYSYRPNLKFPDQQQRRRLEPRLARVELQGQVQVNGVLYPVPSRLSLLEMATRNAQSYYPQRGQSVPTISSEPYLGGLGGGVPLPAQALSEDAQRRIIHTHLDVGRIEVARAALA